AGCFWTATSNVSWLSASPPSGSGNATGKFTVGPNPGNARTGTGMIASGVVFTGTQSANFGVPSISPSSSTFHAIRGTGTFSVSEPACAWTASSNVPWITVTSGSGMKNGTVKYSVGGNTGTSRTGAITVSPGKVFTVTQRAGTCGAINIEQAVTVTRT